MDSDNWEDTFFTKLAQSESPAPNSPVKEDEEDLDIEHTPIIYVAVTGRKRTLFHSKWANM